MSNDPNKLPTDAPGLPTMDTTNAQQTVGDIIFDLFRRHTFTFLIGVLVFCAANFQAVFDNFSAITKEQWIAFGWWQLAALGFKSLSAGVVAVLALLMKSPLAPTK